MARAFAIFESSLDSDAKMTENHWTANDCNTYELCKAAVRKGCQNKTVETMDSLSYILKVRSKSVVFSVSSVTAVF